MSTKPINGFNYKLSHKKHVLVGFDKDVFFIISRQLVPKDVVNSYIHSGFEIIREFKDDAIVQTGIYLGKESLSCVTDFLTNRTNIIKL